MTKRADPSQVRPSSVVLSAHEVRTLLTLEPGLDQLARELRDKFGAKLIWLKAGEVEIGSRDSFKDATPGFLPDWRKAQAAWKEIKARTTARRSTARGKRGLV